MNTPNEISYFISNFEIEKYFPKENNFLIENNLHLLYEKTVFKKYNNTFQIKREIQILNVNNKKVGEFALSGDSIVNGNEFFDSGNPISMTIYIDNNYRGNNLARLMVGELLLQCIKEFPVRVDQLLLIDADGSGGFWDSIGMIQGRYSWNGPNLREPLISREASGYEKEITFSDLATWALGFPLGQGIPFKTRGGRKYKNTKKYKYFKNKKNKKSNKNNKTKRKIIK